MSIYCILHILYMYFILARYRFTTCEDRKGRDMKKLRNCIQLSDWQKCLYWSRFKHETWKLSSFHPFHGLCMLVAERHQSSSYKHHQRPLRRRLNRLGIPACHEAVVGEAAEGTRLSPHSMQHVPGSTVQHMQFPSIPLVCDCLIPNQGWQDSASYCIHSSILPSCPFALLVFLCLWDSTERIMGCTWLGETT